MREPTPSGNTDQARPAISRLRVFALLLIAALAGWFGADLFGGGEPGELPGGADAGAPAGTDQPALDPLGSTSGGTAQSPRAAGAAPEGAGIHGEVLIQSASSAGADTSGLSPAPGRRVTLLRYAGTVETAAGHSDQRRVVASATTSNDGTFRFDLPTPGRYLVMAGSTASRLFEVSSRTVRGIRIVLAPAAKPWTLRGEVRWAGSATPVPDCRVSWLNQEFETTTDSQGRFQFPAQSRRAGAVVLLVSPPGRTAMVHPVRIPGRLVVIELSQQRRSIAGRVVDTQGAPVLGVELRAAIAVTGDPVDAPVAQTGADGAFRFDGLWPQKYILRSVDRLVVQRRPALVLDASAADLADVELVIESAPRDLRIRVWDEAGAAVENADCLYMYAPDDQKPNALTTGPPARTLPGTSNLYSLLLPRNKKVIVLVRAAGLGKRSWTVEADAAVHGVRDVRLDRAEPAPTGEGTLRLTAIDASTGAPIQRFGWIACLTSTDATAPKWIWRSSGAALGDLPDREFDVVVIARNYMPALITRAKPGKDGGTATVAKLQRCDSLVTGVARRRGSDRSLPAVEVSLAVPFEHPLARHPSVRGALFLGASGPRGFAVRAPAGTTTLRFGRRDCRTATTSVTAPARGLEIELEVDPKQTPVRYFTLVAVDAASGADVTPIRWKILKGDAVLLQGESNAVMWQPEPGEFTIRVDAPGYRPWSGPISPGVDVRCELRTR